MAHEDDDYLWTRSGTPDDEIQRLEELLERYRHHAEAVPGGDGQAPAGDTRSDAD